jgi:hypothetical protein
LPAGNFIYRAIYLKSFLILGNPNLKSLSASGLIEKLVYKFIVNLKPSLAVLSIIKNLNIFSPFYALGLITYSAVLNTIVNSKSPPVKDVGIGI